MLEYDKEDFRLYINLIEEIIKRMANNTFIIKGWAITVISALLTIENSFKANFRIDMIIIVVDGAFCFLDCFYLREERLYRNLYSEVIKCSKDKDCKIDYYNLNTKLYTNRRTRYINIICSKLILPLYSMLIFIAFIVNCVG